MFWFTWKVRAAKNFAKNFPKNLLKTKTLPQAWQGFLGEARRLFLGCHTNRDALDADV